MFARPVDNDDWQNIRTLITNHFGQEAIDEANKVWDREEWDEAKVQELLNAHLRTPLHEGMRTVINTNILLVAISDRSPFRRPEKASGLRWSYVMPSSNSCIVQDVNLYSQCFQKVRIVGNGPPFFPKSNFDSVMKKVFCHGLNI